MEKKIDPGHHQNRIEMFLVPRHMPTTHMQEMFTRNVKVRVTRIRIYYFHLFTIASLHSNKTPSCAE